MQKKSKIFISTIILFSILLRVNKKTKYLNQILADQHVLISNQKEKLEQSVQTKNRIFSIIGHDLRGPISTMYSYLEVLSDEDTDVNLLDSIKEFNYNLYLCSLLTYGCLLRPHQEIRLLKWCDFSEDLSHINLTGSKVKSKRNRIVPVPSYIRKILDQGEHHHNIFLIYH